MSNDNLPSINNNIDRDTRLRGLVIVIVCALIIFAGSIITYRMITNRVKMLSLRNLTELSEHNERAMETLLETKWNTLTAIAEHLQMQPVANTEDLLFRLSTTRIFVNCLQLLFISDDGKTCGANFVFGHDDALLAVCKQSGARFARLMASPRAATQGHSMDMVYGVAIEPIKVDGVTYTHLVARTDMDDLQEGIKLDCYNGQGCVRIVDTDGSYLVKADRNRNPNENENFFDIAAKGLPRGWTMDRLHTVMEGRQPFQSEWTDVDGVTYLVSVIPMQKTPWYFVLKAPVQVFIEQSQSLLTIIAVFMAASLLVVVAACSLVFRRTMQMFHAERRHRESLSHALSLADQASRAKTTFLNNMSHDMRTPMNAIIGYTALALSHLSNSARVKDYLNKIAQSSDHLLSLINDVLDMSRIEAGKVNIEEKPESLSDILHHLRNIVLADIHSKSLDLFIDTIDVTDENIICDRLHLTQILLNLMSNAMKFTPIGGTVSLKVTQKPSASHNGCTARWAAYEFCVRDTGIGMSREFMNRVFEPFAREKTTTVSGIEGTGLGLSITRNLVEMMGGKITLQSEEGKGSEFTVYLEFCLHGASRGIGPIEALKELRVLIVDDDIDACQGLSQMLRLMGLRSEWTMHGKEAIVRVEEAIKLGDPFGLYMIDWLMPDMNGVEATRRIRRLAGNDAPIIILSAYDCSDMEDEARDAGVTDFINKPLFAAELRLLLLRVFHIEAASGGDKDKSNEIASDNGIIPAKNGRMQGIGERLLLVEDNELNSEIAVEILKEAGFEVDTAKDGTDAVKIMENARPGQYTAILMDVQMPLMDGYEATRRIRAISDPLVASVPIIALTANVFEEDKEKAFAAGMDAYMGKPISPRLLLETLKQFISKPNIAEINRQ